LRMRRRSLDSFANRTSLIIGAYVWIAGTIAALILHSPFIIASLLGILLISTAMILFVGRVTAKLQTTGAHVSRVLYRLGLGRIDSDYEQLEETMEANLPKRRRRSAHHVILRFGKEVCTTDNPSCEACPLLTCCSYSRSRALG